MPQMIGMTLDPLVLYIADGNERHGQVKAQVCGWSGCKKEGDCVPDKDHQPHRADERNVLSAPLANDVHAHRLDEQIHLLGGLGQWVLKDSLFEASPDDCSRH